MGVRPAVARSVAVVLSVRRTETLPYVDNGEPNVKFGFAKTDITPRVGVELCGFGPFVLRRSVGIRDRLWARAMAAEHDGARAVLVSCDIVGTTPTITAEVRRLIGEDAGIPSDCIMVHCTHTHSGPGIGAYTGWGEPDAPYLELLPQRIARAGCAAVENLQEASLAHAEVPCEGIGLNREQDRDAPPLEDVLDEAWRPAKPHLTDTTCHVLEVTAGDRTIGFLSYFGCHPVVCCAATRYIHGDYCGVATNLLEREHPGAVGLFLQGAQGDVNSCVVHKPEQEAMLALDVIASRYARSVRAGLGAARPVELDRLACARRETTFSRKPWGRDRLADLLADEEAAIHAPDASDADSKMRLAVVKATALRKLIAQFDEGQSLEPASHVQGIRLGPIAFLGAPFEIFQAIKNDVVGRALSPVPLVMGLTNDNLGYAVDHDKAAQGGYAADLVPLMCGALPFANVHDELVQALCDLDRDLQPD